MVGAEHVRPAEESDAVGGLRPRLIVSPGSVREVSRVLAYASRSGLAVVPRGGGTKLGWGNPPSALDLVLSTERLSSVLEYAPGDLVVRAEAGVRSSELEALLAGSGQMLALDPPEPGATLGGVVASATSGPLRLRYGTARDLLIGITVVLSDGTVARAGGKVVKNVAGYDLCKLFTGSLGTLGVIVETIWRLHPLPQALGGVSINVSSPAAAGEAAQAVLSSDLVPECLELGWSSLTEYGTVVLVFGGVSEGVESQVGEATEMLSRFDVPRPLGERDAREALDGLRQHPWSDGSHLGLRLTYPIGELASVLGHVLERARDMSLTAGIRARAGSGVMYVGVQDGDLDRRTGLVRALRARVEQLQGRCAVLEAPPEERVALDAWGSPGDALELMRRVKERFDPTGTLSPGRLVGGI